MCVFICANPKVREWLEMKLARAHRKTFQLCELKPYDCDGVRLNKPPVGRKPQAAICAVEERSKPRVESRVTWLRVCSEPEPIAVQWRRASSPDWHKAFNAIANAWGRLLSLIGLRW